MKDFYKILDIQPSATEEEIKMAYRKLAHRYHPDKGGSEDKFKEINEAYQILSDKYQRGAYDATILIMGQSATYSPATQESTVKDNNDVRNAVIFLILLGIGLWNMTWHGDSNPFYGKLFVFLFWAFVIGAVIVYRKGKSVEVVEEVKTVATSTTKKDPVRTKGQPNVDRDKSTGFKEFVRSCLKTIPALSETPSENIGFDSLISHYLLYQSRYEQNLFVLTPFPKDFWDNLDTRQDDMFKYADYLCELDLRDSTDVKEKKLPIQAEKIIMAMKHSTIKGGELNNNKKFADLANFIFQAELQALGFRLLMTSPSNVLGEFLEKAKKSEVPKNSLRMWAMLEVSDLAKKEGIFPLDIASMDMENKIKQPWMPGIVDLINQMGFVEAIIFIRGIYRAYSISELATLSTPALFSVIKKPFWTTK